MDKNENYFGGTQEFYNTLYTIICIIQSPSVQISWAWKETQHQKV